MVLGFDSGLDLEQAEAFSAVSRVYINTWIWRPAGKSPGLADADGIALGFIVHRYERDTFLSVLIQDEILEGSLVEHEALAIFELAVELHLNPAVFTVAHIGGDLEPAIGQPLRLKAFASDRMLCAFVEQHEGRLGFKVVDGHILGRISAVVAFAPGGNYQSGRHQGAR
jgi:hypothetical protein